MTPQAEASRARLRASAAQTMVDECWADLKMAEIADKIRRQDIAGAPPQVSRS